VPDTSSLDRLTHVLKRAREAAHRAERRTALQAQRESERLIAEDYARNRLAERAKFRRLLSDELQDGLRFRWYFTQIEDSIPLDQLRKWIDGKMNKTEELEGDKVQAR